MGLIVGRGGFEPPTMASLFVTRRPSPCQSDVLTMLDDRPQLRAKIVLLLSLRMIFDDRLVPKRSPVITGVLSKGESSQTERRYLQFLSQLHADGRRASMNPSTLDERNEEEFRLNYITSQYRS